jgi:hypothetical protein
MLGAYHCQLRLALWLVSGSGLRLRCWGWGFGSGAGRGLALGTGLHGLPPRPRGGSVLGSAWEDRATAGLGACWGFAAFWLGFFFSTVGAAVVSRQGPKKNN